MKKHIIAVAVAAAFAAPVAMADTTLYGLANMSLDYIDVGNGYTYTYNQNAPFTKSLTENAVGSGGDLNVQSGSSRIGVKGSEKISNDLSAVYQAEFGVNMSEDSTALSSRNQYVGLSSKSFGTMIAGRHDTPMKLAVAKYDLFGDQIGDNGNIAGAKYGNFGGNTKTAGFNLRTPNTIAYLTPNLAGFNATLAYVADHDQVAPSFNNDNNGNDAFSVSAGYEFKKLFNVTAAYELHNQKVAPAGRGKEDAWMLGAGVNVAGFKVNGLYQQIKNFDAIDNKTNVYGLGAAYTFGKKHTVKGQWYQADYDRYANKQNLFAVGYDFAMSKQTTLFAAYAYGDNGQAVWGDGHGGSTLTTVTSDQNSNAFSVGMKYKF